MKQKPRWTLEMLIAALAVLCALLTLALLVQRPAGWPALAVLVVLWGIGICVFRYQLRRWTAKWVAGGSFENSRTQYSLESLSQPAALLSGETVLWYNSRFRTALLGGEDPLAGRAQKLLPGLDTAQARTPEGQQLNLADVGGEVAIKLVDKLRDRVNEKGLKTGEQASDELRDLIADEMRPEAEMDLSGTPAVILVIGVNGVGKTTSIAKLADFYTRQGKKVMLAAGDTFRAAASEQLEIWADRAGVPLVKAGEGADPAAVIFDTVKSATARGYDLVIADTAGRLHNKANLMAELSKISRSVKKASPEASLETLLVLDAITGQNAISQAREFCKAANATGIILTKLDGTAKGGCVVAVKQRLGLPVRFIGVGEGIDDLIPFTPEGYVEELLPRQWKH